jgi:4-hydroxy-3-methylbut-2-enyl diphosphate reductase
LIDSAADIQLAWVAGKQKIGLSAGASAPEVLVQNVINRLKTLGAGEVSMLPGVEEEVNFPLPKGL